MNLCRSQAVRVIFRGLFVFLLPFHHALAQPAATHNAADIALALQKTTVLGSVLYIGAHPDDENNALLAYLSKGALLRTAYLSATRGDGGQNHIGDEKWDALGILRTQELLAARRIDGAEQFFSRAVDFGYSISPDETLRKWGKNEILADFVWVIRSFRPDILIARFPTTGEGRHGHHTASAILAQEAFRAAGDPARFPEQLRYVKPWQPKRLFWNAWPQAVRSHGGDPDELIQVDIGAYNPLLGAAYTEIGAEARSMHKCQGMGTPKSRGSNITYFQMLAGEPAEKGLFDGIDTAWSRVPGSEKVRALLDEARATFDFTAPDRSLGLLVQSYAELRKLPAADHWVSQKQKELRELVRACAGLWMEATTDMPEVAPGGALTIRATIVSRTAAPLLLQSLVIDAFNQRQEYGQVLVPNRPFTANFSFAVSDSAHDSQPYWLAEPHGGGRFRVPDPRLIGRPENPPVAVLVANLQMQGQEMAFSVPVQHRWRDPFDGDRYRPLEIVPPVTVNFEEKAYIFAGNKAKAIQLRAKAGMDSLSGAVRLEVPQGWGVQPAVQDLHLTRKDDEQMLRFHISPPAGQQSASIRAIVQLGEKSISRSLVRIEYKHVPIQSDFPPATAKLVRVDLRKNEEKIGYVMGAGDDVPQCLRQIGYEVTLLSDAELEKGDLQRFQTIITGIRAYQNRHRLRQLHRRLLEFVRQGGTLIIQYNQNRNLVVDSLGPYPMQLSFQRVTEEEAPVRFVDPGHRLLNYPNKITTADFDGWVQERGLYFADQYDPRYETILSSHDTGMPPLEGGMLYAKYEKGVFIYTGYSWFRQLPVGVPGAYRFFVNLISSRRSRGRD